MCKSVAEALSQNGSCVIRTNGDSMWPLIKSGRDKILLVPAENFLKNDIILYKKNGKLILHRIVAVNKAYYITRGDNYSELQKIFHSEIIGKVEGIFGKKKYHSCNGFYLKTKYLFWKIVFPVINFLRKGRKNNG